jgi:hypothetical protein
MNKTRWLLVDLLILFVGLNVWAAVASGWEGLTRFLAEAGPWGAVLVTDLLISLGLVLTWLWRDARRRGVSPLPYLLTTLATGSVGPLVYLIRFWGRETASAEGPVGGLAPRYEA